MHPDKAHLNRILSPSLEEAEEMNRSYWLSKTPHERWVAVEKLRRLKYGKAAIAPMKRVIELTTWEPYRKPPE
jgi:hypothetical protein